MAVVQNLVVGVLLLHFLKEDLFFVGEPHKAEEIGGGIHVFLLQVSHYCVLVLRLHHDKGVAVEFPDLYLSEGLIENQVVSSDEEPSVFFCDHEKLVLFDTDELHVLKLAQISDLEVLLFEH